MRRNWLRDYSQAIDIAALKKLQVQVSIQLFRSSIIMTDVRQVDDHESYHGTRLPGKYAIALLSPVLCTQHLLFRHTDMRHMSSR